MTTSWDPSEESSYFEALGRLTESAGTLEFMIYAIGDRIFDLAKIRRMTGPPALRSIQEAAHRGVPMEVPPELGLDAWAEAGVDLFERRNELIHVVRVFDGVRGVAGVQRTKNEQAPMRVRDVGEVTTLLREMDNFSMPTGDLMGMLIFRRMTEHPGWTFARDEA